MSDPGTPTAVGLDVGGTKIAAARVAADGTILARERLDTPADDMAATLEAMVSAARSVMTGDVVAVGIGAAGLVESATGVLRFAPNLAWRDAPLVAHVGEALGLRVFADNDANVAAWGEYRFGAGRGHACMLMVTVGTGIGGGIVAGGELYRGAHGFAAEIGHIIVEPDGPACGCGNRGCWEQVASGQAIARSGSAEASRDPGGAIARAAAGATVTGRHVTEAARAGDAAAAAILTEVGRRLGEGLAGLANVLDPSLIVVGGGAAEAGDLLLVPARVAFASAIEARSHRPEVPIVGASLGTDAGVVGAATLALEEVTRS